MTNQDTDLIDRKQAAELIGVSPRTISRYAAAGYLEKLVDARGRVRFSSRQCKAMSHFEPEPAERR